MSAKLLFTHTLPRSRQYRLYPYRYSPFPLPPLVRFSWVLGGRPVYYFGPRALTLGGGWGRPFALVLGVQGLCSAPCPVWGPGLSVSPDGLHGWGRYGATSFAPGFYPESLCLVLFARLTIYIYILSHPRSTFLFYKLFAFLCPLLAGCRLVTSHRRRILHSPSLPSPPLSPPLSRLLAPHLAYLLACCV